MTQLKRLQIKSVALNKMSRKDIEAKLDDVKALVVRAECQLVVTGAIPDSLLSAIESALSLLVPMTAFMSGEMELNNLLSSLRIWVQSARQKNQAEIIQQQNMQSFDNWW